MSGESQRVLLVRGPGGLPGIDLHAGAWLALHQAGIRPTHVSGCSAGAVAAAFQAAGWDPLNFANLVRSLDTADVIRKRAFRHLRAFWLDYWLDPAPIRALLDEHLPQRLNWDLDLTISATWMDQGGAEPAVYFNGRGDLRAEVAASMAIAGLWPYVEINGEFYSDGGTSDALVLPEEDPVPSQRYDLTIIVSIERRTDFHERDRNMLSRLLWNVERLGRVEAEAERRRRPTGPRTLWIELDPSAASMLEFDHGLIEKAEAATTAAVDLWRQRWAARG